MIPSFIRIAIAEAHALTHSCLAEDSGAGMTDASAEGA